MASAPQVSAAGDALMLAIASDRGAARTDAALGVFGIPLHVVAGAQGIAFTHGREAQAYRWEDVKQVGSRRRSVYVQVPHKTLTFRLVIDDVVEPTLSVFFAKVLEELRTKQFSRSGTAWHEYQNAIERVEGEFSDQDDRVPQYAAGGLLVAIGAMSAILVAAMVNAASARAVPAGAFAIGDRIGWTDPRTLIAGFALSALISSWVFRFALGHEALVWARGVARGWHRSTSRVWHLAVRQLGRTFLATSSAAAIVLLATAAFWPTIAQTVLVDQSGVHNEVLLPFVSLDESWRNAVEVTRVDPQSPQDRPGVRIRFADGRAIETSSHMLGGGTETQLFDLAMSWWQAAR